MSWKFTYFLVSVKDSKEGKSALNSVALTSESSAKTLYWPCGTISLSFLGTMKNRSLAEAFSANSKSLVITMGSLARASPNSESSASLMESQLRHFWQTSLKF